MYAGRDVLAHFSSVHPMSVDPSFFIEELKRYIGFSPAGFTKRFPVIETPNGCSQEARSRSHGSS
jgi:hypothetical protein